jgi:hypothetical protein
MTFFYISDDFEDDVRHCIQSWERQHPIAITGLTVEGQVRHFTEPSRQSITTRSAPSAGYGACSFGK